MWSTICSVLARCRIFLWPVLQHGGHSHLPFFAKIFIRRPLGSTLSRQGLGSGTCFFCAILFKDNTHVYYMLYSSYNLEVLIKDLASVIWCLNNWFLRNMFKMVQMMSWRSCSNFYGIRDCNTLGICTILSYSIVGNVKAYIKKLNDILMRKICTLSWRILATRKKARRISVNEDVQVHTWTGLMYKRMWIT